MKHFAKNIIIRRLNSKVKNLFEKNEITVIGVTGSVGKTSAKHAIGEVLAASHKVREFCQNLDPSVQETVVLNNILPCIQDLVRS